jgi:TPR repeat protein
MKSKMFFPLAIACLAVLFGGYLWWSSSLSDKPVPTYSEPASESSAASVDANVDEKADTPALAHTAVGIPVHGAYIPPDQYCSGDRSCMSDPKTAKNPSDYDWLRKHGYPTREEESLYKAVSESQLREEAGRGNLVAISALGERLIATGQREEGLDVLRKAINQGSIYAYYGMSDFYYSGPGKPGSIQQSAAYLRVAYMMGDHEAATLLLHKYGNLSRVELESIDRTAALLYQRSANGRLPSPRPME